MIARTADGFILDHAFEAMAKDPASGLVSYQRYLGGGIWVDVPCSSTLPDEAIPDPPAPAPTPDQGLPGESEPLTEPPDEGPDPDTPNEVGGYPDFPDPSHDFEPAPDDVADYLERLRYEECYNARFV